MVVFFLEETILHLEQIQKHDIYEIDLLIINLYRFKEHYKKHLKIEI